MYQVGGGVPILEVRRFLRRTELPKHAQSWVPQAPTGKDEVYESDLIEFDVSAGRVLGLASVFLASFSESAGPTVVDAPQAACRCRYLYMSSPQRVQPLYCSESKISKWLGQQLVRGFRLSKDIMNDDQLREDIERSRGVRIEATEDAATSTAQELTDSMEDLLPESEAVFSKTLENVMPSSNQAYSSASIEAPQIREAAVGHGDEHKRHGFYSACAGHAHGRLYTN